MLSKSEYKMLLSPAKTPIRRRDALHTMGIPFDGLISQATPMKELLKKAGVDCSDSEEKNDGPVFEDKAVRKKVLERPSKKVMKSTRIHENFNIGSVPRMYFPDFRRVVNSSQSSLDISNNFKSCSLETRKKPRAPHNDNAETKKFNKIPFSTECYVANTKKETKKEFDPLLESSKMWKQNAPYTEKSPVFNKSAAKLGQYPGVSSMQFREQELPNFVRSERNKQYLFKVASPAESSDSDISEDDQDISILLVSLDEDESTNNETSNDTAKTDSNPMDISLELHNLEQRSQRHPLSFTNISSAKATYNGVLETPDVQDFAISPKIYITKSKNHKKRSEKKVPEIKVNDTDAKTEPTGIHLYEWKIRPINLTGLCVEGIRRDMTEEALLWHSTLICKRIAHNVVMTVTGSVYVLVGKMNPSSLKCKEFPSSFLKKFAFGFPQNWKVHFDNYIKELNRSNSKASKGSKAKTKVECKPNSETESLFQKSVQSPNATFSLETIKVTRSGRRIRPPQRLIMDEDFNLATKVRTECQKKCMKVHQTSRKIDSKKKKLKEQRAPAKVPLTINAEVGTLDRKEQMSPFLEHISKDEHGDIFSASPLGNRKVKLATKVRTECQKKCMKVHQTSRKIDSKKKKLKEQRAPAKVPLTINAEVGTLDRKEQMSPFLEQISKDEHGDIFSASPLGNRKVKLATKVRTECQKKCMKVHQTSRKIDSKKKKLKEQRAPAKVPLTINAEVGTLDRKEQMSPFLEQISKDEHGDIFSASPLGNRKVKSLMSKQLATKVRTECQKKCMKVHQTSRKIDSKKKKLKEQRAPAKVPLKINAEVGTLDRKEQMSPFLEQISKDEHGDIFSASPLGNRKVKTCKVLATPSRRVSRKLNDGKTESVVGQLFKKDGEELSNYSSDEDHYFYLDE
ncbi:mis18-binding protein 1-like isoform X2 [Polypterus senegalus]|uniref:mis18-binding protein 1-like isoform X2 n=1 Tax=Polypterus senegalus TaxID=55291 RepID=UPI0019667A59|nr:mis18-binding protein 1-like isoform X2 [Polypterus senegalus]